MPRRMRSKIQDFVTGSGQTSQLCVLTGGTKGQRLALAAAASRERPVLRLSMRQATAPRSMLMAVVDSLFRPLACAPLLSCLGTVWLTLFDMLIVEHCSLHATSGECSTASHQLRHVLSHQRFKLNRIAPVVGFSRRPHVEHPW